MHTRSFGLVGTVFQLAAAALSGVLGIFGQPASISILLGGALFTVGYIFVRLPQMLALYGNDGPKVLLALLYLIIGNGVLSAIFYSIGWLFS